MKEHIENQAIAEEEKAVAETAENVAVEEEAPLDRNIKLMSPTRMIVRRFFRSKLSMIGLIMLAALFLFCFAGPLVYTQWGEIEVDNSPIVEYTSKTV